MKIFNRQDAKDAEVGERGERIESGERGERIESGERGERIESGERGERIESGERIELGEKIEIEERVEERTRNEPGVELDELAGRVIGSAIEVHRHLGPGFMEVVYEEALAVEFRLRGIGFERQKVIVVGYKDHPIGEGRLDFLVSGCLIVELKAIESLAPIHKAQVISYLKATRLHLGLLINFNVPILKNGLQRIILS